MDEAATFTVDLGAPTKPLRQPWQWCVGSGHATLALRADWQAHLAQARRDLGFRHVRFHGILDDDMGTLICQNDEPLYSFFNTDRIFDFLVSIGMKPVVELSFMPRTLSSGNDIVFHYQGNITPPKDLGRWGELVRRLASHWVERYGIDEVATWPFECWNEPNLPAFWTGDRAAYFALYRTTASAIKAVDARLQIGGPVTAGNAWLDEFKAFCAEGSVPFDFLSTHYYPTDPFGAIDADTTTQLEHSPPDVMRTRALEARAIAGTLPLYYTEWSISSNPRDPFHDDCFAAAFAARIAMSVDEVVDGYSYWTFSDLFEENYFPSVPFHGGFGMMNLYGVPKPIYRAFEMLRSLGNARRDVQGSHPNVVVWCGADGHTGGSGDSAGAVVSSDTTTVVLINQAMPRHAIASERIVMSVVPPAASMVDAVTVERIDDEHANPAGAWRAMGSPEYLTPAQVEALIDVSKPAAEAQPFATNDGRIVIDLLLAPQSVNRLRLRWRPVR